MDLFKGIVDQDAQLAARIYTHGIVSTELAMLSDQRLTELLEGATSVGVGIGGSAALLTITGTPVFVKKLRLSDIERQPANIRSTANVFGLPLYYQYGIGSAGFGVWRELSVHAMTTDWVLSGECPNFPLMYHWRILPEQASEPTPEQLKNIDASVEQWGGSPAIRKRLLASLKASAHVVLFLEHIPNNLNTWLSEQIAQGAEVSESACIMVEKNLKSIISFMNSQGLLHFDAHFENILTDGHQLYFSDFGLALSSHFELSKAEMDFFEKHHNYDRCFAMAYWVEWILIELFGIENSDILLQECAVGRGDLTVAPVMAAIIERYAPMAVVMHDFYQKLKEDKSTSYPADELDRIYALSVQ